MKQVKVDKSFIKHELKEGGIKLCHISTQMQEAKFFTKILPKPNFKFILGKLGMMNIYFST